MTDRIAEQEQNIRADLAKAPSEFYWRSRFLLARLDACRQKLANLADLYWHDCRVKGKRGASYCRFEGTKVCTVCLLADVKKERDILSLKLCSMMKGRT